MLHRHAPEALARPIEARKLGPFSVGDAEGVELGGVGGLAAALDIEDSPSFRIDPEDLDDLAVVGRDPRSLFAVVLPHGHDAAHREIEEIVDINGQRLAEINLSHRPARAVLRFDYPRRREAGSPGCRPCGPRSQH
jgi:hypothetical protein